LSRLSRKSKPSLGVPGNSSKNITLLFSMIRMVIFSIIVVLAIFALFPSDKIAKTSRQQMLLEISESGDLVTLVNELEAEYEASPRDLHLLQTKIEAMMYGEQNQFLERIVESCRQLAAQSTDLGWFENFFRNPVPRVREQALIAAQRLGWVRMLPHIKELAHDKDLQVKASATRALVELAPIQERFLLRMACHDGADNVRAVAVTSFQYEMEPVDARRLFRLLDDTSEMVRQNSMQTLIKGIHEGVVPDYERHAGGRESLRGAVATISLAKAGNTHALEQLPEIIATAEDMRLPAAAYVLATRDRAAAEELAETLRQQASRAANELARARRARAVEALERSLQLSDEDEAGEAEGPLAQMLGEPVAW
jgi:hypothetical protein